MAARATTVDTEIVRCLIEVGEVADLQAGLTPPRARLLRAHVRCSMLHWQTWLDAVAELSTPDLTSLVRGFAAAIKWLGWNGGSPSPIIWLFKELEARLPFQEAFDLADWISRNVPGYYLPFGGVRRAEAFERIQSPVGPREGPLDQRMALAAFALELHRDERRRFVETDQAAEKAARLERRSRRATEHRVRKVARDIGRYALLAKAAPPDPVGRLRLLLELANRPLAYFPCSWAEVAAGVLQQLTEEERKRLALRVATARKRPWSGLCEELARLARPV